jgi:hypothetical protein
LAAYSRRTPETTLLYRVVQENLETFLAETEESGRAVPRFVERELRAFLDCGILRRGFLRVRCKDCGDERLVAFSCKGRGFCPSCTSRRMSDTAAHLVDRVFPQAPVRQWVLSLPIPLRYRVAYDHKLCSAVLAVFLRAVFGALQRRAKEELGVVGGRSGSVTFVQRFGGSINLHTHFHAIVLDGVYADPEDLGTPRFFALSPVSDEEVARVTATVAKRVVALLIRRGLLEEEGLVGVDSLEEDEPLLAACAQASVRHRIATGSRAGKPVMRLGDRFEIEEVESRVGEQCAAVWGFSLHAGVAIGARIGNEWRGSVGIFRDLRSPENGCSNSPMGGSHIDFVTCGGAGRHMLCSGQASYLKNSLSSCPGPAAMRFSTTECSRQGRSGERL